MDNQKSDLIAGLNLVRRILAVIGVIFIAVGEFLMIAPPAIEDKLPPGYWVPAVGILMLLSSFFIKTSPAIEARLARFSISQRVFDIIISLILCGLTLFSLVLFRNYNVANFSPVTFIWLASGFMYLLAFNETQPSEFDLRTWFKKYQVELILLGLAITIGAALRLYQLGYIPRIIDGDEGLIGLNAQLTTAGDLASPFSLWENFGSLYLQLVNFVFNIFGVSPFSLRLLPAISGILAIPALYLLAREIAGPRIAIITAFLIATSHAHIHFSRISSVGYIHGSWIIPLELFFLFRGLKKRSSFLAAAGGLMLAIHFRIYLSSQLIAGLVIVYMLILLVWYRPWFGMARKQALIFWGGFLLMMAPQLRYIIANPKEFFNRLMQDGTFQSGWLQQKMVDTGHSAFQILAEQFFHAFLTLIHFPAIDFYGASFPLLTFFTATFFLIGIGLILTRIKSPSYLLLNGYFWGGTFAIGILTVPPSAASYRMLIVLPAALLIAAIGFDKLLEVIGFQWEVSRRTYIALAALTVLMISFLNVNIYYTDFAGKCRYGGNLEGRFASYLGSFSKTVDENSEIYLLSDSIYFYGSHASTDFLSGKRKITNYSDPLESYQVQFGETLVASPDRIDELLDWVSHHRGGQLTTLKDCEKVILVAYKLPEKTFEP